MEKNQSVFQSHMISEANDLNPSPHITLFTSGCNFKCGYCFNPSLVSETVRVKLTKNMVEKYVKKYSSTYPVVVITGGEPLMHTQLINEVKLLKEANPDAKFELCTNGSLSRMVERSLEAEVFDSYRIDYKLPRSVFAPEFVGIPNYFDVLDEVERSIILVRGSGKELEVRTVFHSEYLDTFAIGEIMNSVSLMDVKNYGVIYFTDESRTVGNFPKSDSSKLDVGLLQDYAKNMNISLRFYRQ